MTREEVKVESAGLAHDHKLLVNHFTNLTPPTMLKHPKQQLSSNGTNHKLHNTQPQENSSSATQSTIAILRRHPMYDCLVLVKRFRSCLNGYTLEFPTTTTTTAVADAVEDGHENENEMAARRETNHEDCCKTKLVSVYLDDDDPIYQCQEQRSKATVGDQVAEGELVYVPINGLLDRLDNYDRQGVAIDSRVYAFAMGLKMAEKFLTTSSMKEIQETPPL